MQTTKRFILQQYYDDNTLNVCMESTYQFVDKVIDEIAVTPSRGSTIDALLHWCR